MESKPRSGNADAPRDVTRLLLDWSHGDRAALDALTPLIYRELHRLAQSHLRRERPGHTLQPTALIHEAYVRMASQSLPEFESRKHFFGVAAHYMRQILVDHARARRAQKRRGEDRTVPLNDAATYSEEHPEDLLTLDRALDALAKLDERKARIVELRYFGGLTPPETAEMMRISISTVGRELRAAEAWLRREIAGRL
jgi:RNA polymerase sigma-70 factor, ECF subfamily